MPSSQTNRFVRDFAESARVCSRCKAPAQSGGENWESSGAHCHSIRDHRQFFAGFSEALRKQADREADINAQYQKTVTNYFRLEQYEAARQKLLPQESKKSPPDQTEVEQWLRISEQNFRVDKWNPCQGYAATRSSSFVK